MKFKYLIIIFISLHASRGYSQFELPTIASPEAYSFQKFGSHEVNYKTGTPNIEIPLYSFDANELVIPISLRYHASGIRVTEQSTCVGLGWDLQAGGRITRQVKGLADESQFGLLNAGAIQYHSDIALPNPQSPQDQKNYFNAVARGDLDTQPDLFSISVPGINASFYFDSEGIAHFTKGESFVVNSSLNSTLLPLEVIGDTGIKYKFDLFEETENQDWYGKTTYDQHSWVLTEIEFTNGEKVLYNYHEPVKISDTMVDFSAMDSRILFKETTCISPGSSPISSSRVITTVDNLYLEDITYKNAKILFHYNGSRQDGSGWRLTDVTIQHLRNGSYEQTKKCILDNDHYFIREDFPVNVPSFQTNSKHERSLMLKGVFFYGVNELMSYDYEIDYHTDVDLPVRSSLSRDHWGFYNGADNSSLIPVIHLERTDGNIDIGDANREVSKEHAKAGMIKSIRYPTGGKSVYEFESNTSSVKKYLTHLTQKNFIVEGKSVNEQEVVTDRLERVFAVGEDWNEVELTYSFSGYAQMGEAPEIWLYEEGESLPLANEKYAISSDGNFGLSQSGATELWSLKGLEKGKNYRLVMDLKGAVGVTSDYVPGDIIDPNTIRSNIKVKISGQVKGGLEEDELVLIGGLRIATITNEDSNGEVLNKKVFQYGTRSGNLPLINHASYQVRFENDDYYTKVSQVQYACSSTKIYIFNFNSFPYKYGMEGLKPFVEYSYVSITELNQRDEIGAIKELHYSTPIAELYGLTENAFKIYFPEYRSSHLTAERNLVPDGLETRLISETKYVYTETPTYWLEAINIEKLAVLHSGTNWSYADSYLLRGSYPELSIGTNNLTSKTTINYENLSLITNESFKYEGLNHNYLTGTEKETSDGKIKATKYRYPQDYLVTTEAPISKMKAANMLAIPIETTQLIDGNAIASYGIEYDEVGTNNLIYPVNYFQYESITPGDNFFNSVDGIDFSSYTLKESILKRDDLGNVISHKTEDNLITTYIWGYDQTLPVAKIVNATIAEVNEVLGLGANLNVTTDLTVDQNNQLRNANTLQKALITTYTYQVGVGVDSVMDPIGNLSTYVYDELGRLKFVKDQDNNIIKKFEYRFSQ